MEQDSSEQLTPSQVALLYGTLSKSASLSLVPKTALDQSFTVAPSPSTLLHSEWLSMSHAFSGTYRNFSSDLAVLNELYRFHDGSVYPDVHSGEKVRQRVWNQSATKIQAVWRGRRTRELKPWRRPFVTQVYKKPRALYTRKDVAILKQGFETVVKERGLLSGVSLEDLCCWLEARTFECASPIYQGHPDTALLAEAIITDLRNCERNQVRRMSCERFVEFFLQESTDDKLRNRTLNLLTFLLSHPEEVYDEEDENVKALERLYTFIARRHSGELHCRTLAAELVELSGSRLKGKEVRQLLTLGARNGNVYKEHFVRFIMELRLHVPSSKLVREVFNVAWNLGQPQESPATEVSTRVSPRPGYSGRGGSPRSSLKGMASSLALHYYEGRKGGSYVS